MSATLLIFCFVCLKASTCETRKMFFISLRKLFSFLRYIIKFYSNIMMSSNARAWNMKHLLLNNWGSKHSLQLNFASLCLLQNKIFIKKFYEKCDLESSPRPFLIFKESSVKRILWRWACWFRQILIVLLLHI